MGELRCAPPGCYQADQQADHQRPHTSGTCQSPSQGHNTCTAQTGAEDQTLSWVSDLGRAFVPLAKVALHFVPRLPASLWPSFLAGHRPGTLTSLWHSCSGCPSGSTLEQQDPLLSGATENLTRAQLLAGISWFPVQPLADPVPGSVWQCQVSLHQVRRACVCHLLDTSPPEAAAVLPPFPLALLGAAGLAAQRMPGGQEHLHALGIHPAHHIQDSRSPCKGPAWVCSWLRSSGKWIFKGFPKMKKYFSFWVYPAWLIFV